MDAKLQLDDIDHAVLTSDGLAAGCATLGKELAKAIGTVGLVITRGEPLARE